MSRRKQQKSPLWAALLVLFGLAAGIIFGTNSQTKPASQMETEKNSSTQTAPADTLIYYLDVGQGDCELIRLKTGENILIDAGTGETAQELSEYLKRLGVEKIDILIATHPHADHIGGMAQVVNRFPIGELYMPKIPDSQIPTTSTYEKLLEAIDRKGLKINAAKAGKTILESNGEKIEILAPNSAKYDGLNSYSVVTMLTSGKKRFLFTGDAESDSEKEMVKMKYDLKCDVLKCGHHGSSTSTSAAFLKAAAPASAVISCGVDNDYGHPNKAVLDRLKKADVTVYRTDRQDTILACCDGETIRFTTGLKSVMKSKGSR